MTPGAKLERKKPSLSGEQLSLLAGMQQHSALSGTLEGQQSVATSSRSPSFIVGDLERAEAYSPRTAARQRSSREACYTLVNAWISRKFLMGVCILFPVAVTAYVTWWFLTFFDNFFSPIFRHIFNFHVFGLGFITSMLFILGVGVFFSSWLGTALLNLGEWIIKRLPLIRHIYSASKQVSAALNPENESTKAFQECVLIKHPRQGEFAFGFITGRTVVQNGANGDLKLTLVYVPTNHIYVGDILLLEDKDIIHTDLTVREGLEVVVSVGMSVPPSLMARKPPFSHTQP